jgi:hypothetical protein
MEVNVLADFTFAYKNEIVAAVISTSIEVLDIKQHCIVYQ